MAAMTRFERATQIWAVLGLAARNRQTLTYEMFGQLIGVPPRGLGNLLDTIQAYCLKNELPPLTVLAVSKESGLPGSGFVAAEDIPRALQSVFNFDWLEHGAPSVEDLTQAMQQPPSP